MIAKYFFWNLSALVFLSGCESPPGKVQLSPVAVDLLLSKSMEEVNRVVPDTPCQTIHLTSYEGGTDGARSMWFCRAGERRYEVSVFVPADGSKPEVLRTSAEPEHNIPSGTVLNIVVEKER